MIFFELGLWNTADACSIEVRFLGLYATKTAELESIVKKGQLRQSSYLGGQVPLLSGWGSTQSYLLITLFLPFRNQVGIGIVVFKKPVVKLLGYRLFLVVQVVDVSGALEKRTQEVSDALRAWRRRFICLR